MAIQVPLLAPPLRQNVTGLICAARDLGALVASASQIIEIARIPENALLLEIGYFTSATLTTPNVGFEPIPGNTSPTADVDAFHASASGSLVQNSRTLLTGTSAAGGRLPQLVPAGGISITLQTATAITASIGGTMWALYTMDAYVDNTDQLQLLSSAS